MKRTIFVLTALLLVTSIWADARWDQPTSPRPHYASDLIKIKLSPEAIGRTDLPTGLYAEADRFGFAELDELMLQTGGTAVIRAHRRLKNKAWEAENGFDRWFLVRLNGRMSVEDALALFKANRFIEDGSFEYYAYTQFIPDDGYFAQNWGHNNTGQGPGGGGVGFDSNAPEAWDQYQVFGSADIIIAIIDSGVNYNHADLNDNCIPGYDYGQNDPDPMDSHGHGTQCAGVSAGETNNGIGVAGVAGGCSIMPIKVMNNSGSMTFTYITNGITHAADNNADVISMSLGAENGTEEGDYPTCDTALYYAYNAGCTIFAATANSNTSAIAYPANHTSVISVGAASPTGQRKSSTSSDGQNWWGSNYGVNIQDDPKAVDIMAATILPATTTNGSYSTNFNGTSCATPYAAGVAALVKSKDPTLTPAQVRQVLVSSATDMTIDGGPGWDRYTGYGMVNADAALALVAPGMPTCVITAPENNSGHDLGSLITVLVTSVDSNGSIVDVKFYLDDNLTPEFTDTEAPYAWHWDTQGQPAGEHTIRAVATDNEENVRQTQITVVLLIPANEGFESGLFNLYAWNNSSPNPWTIQSLESYSGNFAAKAGEISHNEESLLSLELNILESGTISFFNKVSSESNYDYMRFFIDGVQQGQWSGTLNWSYQSYPVSAGLRTFTWTYAKDQGVDGGSDTAWLDHIVFPAHNAPPAAPSNLIATPASPTRVMLTWRDNSYDEDEFYIERSSGTTWDLVDWAPENTTAALNTGLNSLSQYSFRVRAYNANGSSNYSNVAYVTTLGPDSPEAVTAAGNGSQVDLSWEAPQSGADSYSIWRYEYVSGFFNSGVCLTPDPITGTTFSDSDWYLQTEGNYLWKVIAISGALESPPSLSNLLPKEQNGSVIGNVTNLSGDPIADACVSCGPVAAQSDGSGAYTLSLMPGTYSLTATHPDYEDVTLENVTVTSGLMFVANFQLPLFTVETPVFCPEPGAYVGPVDVTLSCGTADAEIRFTLDGSDPTDDSELYTVPIHLEQSATVKARACLLNCAPSQIAEASYTVTVSNDDPVAPGVAGIQNVYPNPFSNSAYIDVYLKDANAPYTLSVYNLRGELVYRASGLERGRFSLTWDGTDRQGRKLGAGVYLIRLVNGGLKQHRKVVLK